VVEPCLMIVRRGFDNDGGLKLRVLHRGDRTRAEIVDQAE
jgi:hypothetical protein